MSEARKSPRSMTIPDDMWAELQAYAEAENRSVSNFVHTMFLQWKQMRSTEEERREAAAA